MICGGQKEATSEGIRGDRLEVGAELEKWSYWKLVVFLGIGDRLQVQDSRLTFFFFFFLQTGQ